MASYELQELVEISYLSSHVFLNVGSLDLSMRDDVEKINLIWNSIE